MSYYSVQDGLFKSYLSGHLRKRSTFRYQLVLPNALIGLVLHAYHDHALSEGHFAFRPTYDKIRQKYWWPTMNRDVHKWCQECQACQRRNTAHHPTTTNRQSTCWATVPKKFCRLSRIQIRISFGRRCQMQNSSIYDGPPNNVYITDTNSKLISWHSCKGYYWSHYRHFRSTAHVTFRSRPGVWE